MGSKSWMVFAAPDLSQTFCDYQGQNQQRTKQDGDKQSLVRKEVVQYCRHICRMIFVCQRVWRGEDQHRNNKNFHEVIPRAVS